MATQVPFLPQKRGISMQPPCQKMGGRLLLLAYRGDKQIFTQNLSQGMATSKILAKSEKVPWAENGPWGYGTKFLRKVCNEVFYWKNNHRIYILCKNFPEWAKIEGDMHLFLWQTLDLRPILRNFAEFCGILRKFCGSIAPPIRSRGCFKIM
jgi:hypothetical protein